MTKKINALALAALLATSLTAFAGETKSTDKKQKTDGKVCEKSEKKCDHKDGKHAEKCEKNEKNEKKSE